MKFEWNYVYFNEIMIDEMSMMCKIVDIVHFFNFDNTESDKIIRWNINQ